METFPICRFQIFCGTLCHIFILTILNNWCMSQRLHPRRPYQFVVKTPSRNVWPLVKPEQNGFGVADFSFFLLSWSFLYYQLLVSRTITVERPWARRFERGVSRISLGGKKGSFSFFPPLRSKVTEHARPLKGKELSPSLDYSLFLPSFTFWPNSPF